MEYFKICASVALCSAVISLISKGDKELSTLISTAFYVIVMLYAVSKIGTSFNFVKESFNFGTNLPGVDKLLKAGGIGIIGAVSSSICEDVGQRGAAKAIEIITVFEILTISLSFSLEIVKRIIELFG